MEEDKELDTLNEDTENDKVNETIIDTGVEVVATEDVSAAIYDTRSTRITAEVYSWFDTILHALVIMVAVFTFFTRMSTVDGTSMLPTLEDNQQLMLTDLFYTPTYNDIVVVWSDFLPNDEGGRGKAIVKRVIGLPGDTINIDYDNGRVYRNGELLEIEMKDGLLFEDGHQINSYTNEEEGSGGDFTVPEGCLFVMGDNRNGSTDSRSYLVGYVDERNIVGKAYMRIWPFNQFKLF